MDKRFLEYLSTYVTKNKYGKMDKVLSMRTRHITVAMENLHKPHNGSAVLRTCECFGIQDIHLIEKTNKYKANPYVTRGSSKWIDVIKHTGEANDGVKQCYDSLKAKGYTIYATSPGKGSIPLDQIDVTGKVALIFGNEYEGLSEYAIKHADEKISLPMYGFTESYNISVTAAICLYNLTEKLRASEIPWQLTPEEKDFLRLKWMKKVVKHSDIIEKNFYK